MILSKENIESINIGGLISDLIAGGNHEKFLLIVPTNRRLRKLKKEIIDSSPGKVTGKINIETFSTLSSRLLKQYNEFSELSEAASTVFIKQSSSEAALKYFLNYRDEFPAGTLDRIRNVISKYKENGVSPQRIRAEAQNLSDPEKQKALDIAEIYDIYLQKCSELKAYEIGDIYNKLLEIKVDNTIESFLRLFTSVDLTVIDGFDEFTDPEIQIIDRLSRLKSNRLFIVFDYYRYNPSIFTHLDKCYDKFILAGFKNIAGTAPHEDNKFKQAIKEKLFLKKPVKPDNSFREKIIKLSALDRNNEVELIAKEIKYILSKDKVKPSHICVAFNLIDNYSHIVEDVFNTYGIPTNLTDRIYLKRTVPALTILNFLEIIGSDYHFKNIARAFSGETLLNRNIDLSNLISVANNLKIIYGFYKWNSRIKEALNMLEVSGEEPYEIFRKKNSFEKALTDLNYIDDLLNPFKCKLTIKAFMIELNDLIFKLGLTQNLLKDGSSRAEENIKSLTTFIETMEEIFGLLNTGMNKTTKFELNFFIDNIKTTLGWARFNVKEKSDYGVLVTSFNEIRGLRFDHLFIGGLIDGDFPTRFSPEIFMSGSYQKSELIHQSEERYRFYQTLCAWDKSLYLSAPRVEAGKELVESSFIKELSQLFTVAEKNENDFRNQIYSFEEFQINFVPDKIEESLIGIFDAENLKRRVGIENARLEDGSYKGVFNGYLLGDDIDINQSDKDFISAKLNDFITKQFSPSELETYAKCPFKYFLEKILKISAALEPTETLEAIELGSLIHSILFDFYSAVTRKNIRIQGCDDKTFRYVFELLRKISEAKLEMILFNKDYAFYDIEKLIGMNGDFKQSILYKFIEAERNEEKFLPNFFEVSFGAANKLDTDTALSSREPVTIEDVKLRGKIDRIDICRSESKFNIVDYKLSGAKPSENDLRQGVSLQLPVYMLAAKILLENNLGKEFLPNEMQIFSLKYNERDFGKKKISLSRKKDSDHLELCAELIETAKTHIKKYIEQIQKGNFNLSRLEGREEKVCRFCNFKAVCRIEDIVS